MSDNSDTPPPPVGNLNVFTDAQLQQLIQSLRATPVPTPSPAPLPPPPAPAAVEPIPPFVPPPATPSSSESLLDRFPFLSRSIILEIIRHDILPLNLYKLDINAQEKAADAKSTVDIEDGRFTVRDRSGALKDYPTFASLLEPLLVYFNVLGAHAASSGNAQAVFSLLEACTTYSSHLSLLSRDYQWSAVLTYHKHFFPCRQKEMAKGIYTGWLSTDANLIALYLLNHSRPAHASAKSSKSSTSSSASARASASTQICFNFNKGSCTTSPCPAGRIHKCQKCDSAGHGSITCTKGQ